MQPLPDFLLRQTIRNSNFLRLGLGSLTTGGLFLVINIASSSGLEWFGWLLFLLCTAVGAVYVASWLRVVLDVVDDGVRLGGVFGTRVVQWNEIDHFEIRGPAERTPFMLAFRPWADQGRIFLRNGTIRRMRAVEPWHGFTVLTYYSLSGGTTSDEIISALNRHLQQVISAR